jgi:hypothetical protein
LVPSGVIAHLERWARAKKKGRASGLTRTATWTSIFRRFLYAISAVLTNTT